MASKKLKSLVVLGLLLSVGATAQVPITSTSGYDVYDSTVVPRNRMSQQTEFWNNTYNFPAKPRNMWEVGVKAGAATMFGDVSAKVPTLGFGAHVRKSLGYVFSLRGEFVMGNMKGLNWRASEQFSKNQGWVNAGYQAITRDAAGNLVPTGNFVYHNYKTEFKDLSLQGIVTLNNLRFHKDRTNMILYGGAGIGATLYETSINALNGSSSYQTLFNNVQGSTSGLHKDRKSILDQLKDGMDDSYETAAESESKQRRAGMGDGTLRATGTVLVGIAYKLGRRVNIALEDRHTFTKDDLLDGQRWQEHAQGDPVLTSDFDSYNMLTLGLNFNIGANAVEPLYWLNPLDYAYGELNNPRHTKFPKPVFDDADGDGVVDQLDREPNTPAGCPVDTHGVSRDTDGDGVPDCLDKQLITPTECQPVDSSGVGKCPDPECCKNVVPPCPLDYPSLTFSGRGSALNSDLRAMLATVAAKMKVSPACNITITGYPEASKSAQALCQKRVEEIKKYLVETQGISADRISTDCVVDGGDRNTIDIKSN